MNYTICYSKHINWKRFRSLSVRDKKHIREAIEKKLSTNPTEFGKPLRKSLYGCRSLRVGSYRIIYRIERNTVEILLFGHRSTVYSDAEKVV